MTASIAVESSSPRTDVDTAPARPVASIGPRVLVVAPFAPSRTAMHGASRAMGGLLWELSSRGPTGLVHVRSQPSDMVDEELGHRLEFVTAVDRSTPIGRVRQAVALVRGTPLWMQSWWSDALRGAIEHAITTWKPDIVQIELDVMAPAVAIAASRGIPAVFVVHEPASAMSGPSSSLLGRLERRAWSRVERCATERATHTVAFTERDAALIGSDRARTTIIPLGTDVGIGSVASRAVGSRASRRPRVVFVGGAVHPPNVDAVDRLIGRILPRLLARRDEVTLVIVGDRGDRPVPRCVCGAARCKHLDVTGRVDDVDQYLHEADVVVAPLRLGGGMRVKVLDAMAAGSAVVATSLALSGLEEAIGAGAVCRADTDREFVEAIESVLADPQVGERMRADAHRWALSNLSWSDRAVAYAALHDQLTPSRVVPSRLGG